MEALNLKPFQTKVCAQFELPSSKSITNRAFLLSAMNDSAVCLGNPLIARDTHIMLECLKSLGYSIEIYPDNITISGECKKIAKLNVGNAGTVARFLTAFVCTQLDGDYFFDSDAAMYLRPMKGLIQALEKQGAEFTFKKEKYCFPFMVKTKGLKGGKICLDASESSQILSAVLMAAPLAAGDTFVELESATVSKPFVGMTLKMMRDFGFCVEADNDGAFKIEHGITVAPSHYDIEADATAASYPVALVAALGGAVLIENFPTDELQGDTKFAYLMRDAGFVKLSRIGKDMLAVKTENPPSGETKKFDFNDISDTFLSLAAIVPALREKIEIHGIAHTRKQETDRVFAIETEISKFAKSVKSTKDSLQIEALKIEELAKKITKPIAVDTYEDHRIAMSMALLGSLDLHKNGEEWMTIKDPNCVSKTFPHFFEVLEKVRKSSAKFKVVAIDGGAAVGKSSVSKECAKTLNYMHVDTGAHYRTLSYILLKNNIPSDSEDAVSKFLKSVKISFTLEGNSAKMSVAGESISDADIRNDKVNANVSIYAAMPAVREFLKKYQRSMSDEAKKNNFAGLVMEGRDIGSVIFPKANLKIFLDADEETRALRRKKEGIGDSIAKRDALDKTRKTAPLTCEKDAKRIDTSNMTKDEVVAKALALIIKA